MARFLSFVLSLFLLIPAASADPLVPAEDYADTVTVFYNETDSSDGQYVYSYRYPCILNPEDLSGVCVNEYYMKKIQEYRDFYIPSQASDYGSRYENVNITVSYEITCNDDRFFSVLIHKTEDVEGEVTETWEGNTFSRSSEVIGSLTSLPNLLGLLEDGGSDEWLEERQTMKVWKALCSLVWDAVRANPGGTEYREDLEKEDLEILIDPVLSLDQDFFLDESGNIVFFILPGRIAPESAGLLTFAFSPDEILDEL